MIRRERRLEIKRLKPARSKKSAWRVRSQKLGYALVTRSRTDCRGTREMEWRVRRDPETPVHLEKTRIEIDGQPVRPQSTIYLALNKPRAW